MAIGRVMWKQKKNQWHHITISQLREASDSTDDADYMLSIRVNHKRIYYQKNNLDNNQNGLRVYASSPDYESMANAKQIDLFKLHNLRLIKQMRRYVVRFGISNYILRVGPSTLTDAKKFCADEGMTLYKPKNREVLHRLIFDKVSKYGATTFWTQVQHVYASNDYSTLQKSKMEWMDGTPTTTTPIPDWLFNQWKHTHTMYYIDDNNWDKQMVGGCAIVGFVNRRSQVTAVKCGGDEEVADILCQPN